MIKRVPLPEEPMVGEETVERYDKGAKKYMWPEYKYFVRKILSRGKTGGIVLDIGTGSGLLALELAKSKGNTFDIISIDASSNMLERAKKNTTEKGQKNKTQLLLANGAKIPFPDKTFDLVISYASLHHWLEPVSIFDEIERVTKDNGTIIIRDNKRIYTNPLLRFSVWIVSRFMNRGHREIWYKAMAASYTISEIKEILRNSRLRDCRVRSDFMKIDVCIESTQ